MHILISEKNGCVYTWNHVENCLMYTPLYENNTFNILDFWEVTDFAGDDEEFYKLKAILRGYHVKSR